MLYRDQVAVRLNQLLDLLRLCYEDINVVTLCQHLGLDNVDELEKYFILVQDR
jgi:hypothetical protein